MRAWWPLFCTALGCAGSAQATYTATFTDRAIRVESYARAFRNAEPALVASLAVQGRLLVRITPRPSSAEVASEGTAMPLGSGVWLAREPNDPFIFADRQSALEQERRRFTEIELPADAALEGEIRAAHAAGQPTPEEALLASVKLEQAAFRRMIDAEDARLEKERTLPRAAADLVRALSLEWPLSPKPGALGNLESMLAFRFQNLDESLTPNTLTGAERDDLRDALADLAPRVAGLRRAASMMAKLTHTLDSTWVTPYALEDEREMDRDLTLYVGAPLAFDALDGAFESAARGFEAQATAGLSVLDSAAALRIKARAEEMLMRSPACLPRIPVRTPLDMAPPDERAWSCSLLHAFDDVRGDEAEIAADLAWHDAIVVARWAVSTHGPVRSPEAAMRRATLSLPLAAADSKKLMRLAQAHPMRAIAAGVAASILMKHGAAHARARARRWRGIGDAPMDLVDDALSGSGA
jgi:hypothetical protein